MIRGTPVQVLGDDRGVTVRWHESATRSIGVWAAAVVITLPVAGALQLVEEIPASVAIGCGFLPLVLAALVASALGRARMEVHLSAQGIERRGVNGLGLPVSARWPGPITVHVAPFWNFDVKGAIHGFDQYNVGFTGPRGIAVEELMLSPETTQTLVDALERLNTAAIVLNVRLLQAVRPSSLCACGYDLIGVPGRVCPECGIAIDANRFEVLRRMHVESRAKIETNRRTTGAVQESEQEQP